MQSNPKYILCYTPWPGARTGCGTIVGQTGGGGSESFLGQTGGGGVAAFLGKTGGGTVVLPATCSRPTTRPIGRVRATIDDRPARYSLEFDLENDKDGPRVAWRRVGATRGSRRTCSEFSGV